jgi:hypothetical protein
MERIFLTPTEFWTPDRPACGESLCSLRYPGPLLLCVQRVLSFLKSQLWPFKCVLPALRLKKRQHFFQVLTINKDCAPEQHWRLCLCNGDYVSCDVEMWILNVLYSIFRHQSFHAERTVSYHNELPKICIFAAVYVCMSISLGPFQIYEFSNRLFAILQMSLDFLSIYCRYVMVTLPLRLWVTSKPEFLKSLDFHRLHVYRAASVTTKLGFWVTLQTASAWGPDFNGLNRPRSKIW